MSFNLEFLAKSRIPSRNFRFFRLNFVGILEFPSLVSSPDLIGGSRHREFRIPMGFLRLYHLRILEFHIEILGSSPRMT